MSIILENNPLRERRSVFPAQYTGELIDDQIIWEILKDANNAPSHRHTEPWRFKVYADSSKLRLCQDLADAYKANSTPDQFSEIKYVKTIKKAELSSHIIAIVLYRSPSSPVPEWEEIAATACAVENIYLSCTLRKLGCYWSSPKSVCQDDSIIELDENERCLGLLYLGKPKPDLAPKAKKSAIESKVIWYR